VTLAEAHVLLSKLLQQMESGTTEGLLSGVERSVRNASPAQALARQYATLLDGARIVKVGTVQFKGESRDDRLVVSGQVALEITDRGVSRMRELPLQAEFAKHDGAVVMTRLAPGAQKQ
jgi:hypothetical protein